MMFATLLNGLHGTSNGVLLAQESFFESWTFIIIMGVLFLGLVGLLIFLRMKQNSDD